MSPVRLTVLPPSRSLAEAVGSAEPAFGRTLRFALAMRGGVSLAVWIGGAVAELDVLRRIRLYRDGSGVLHAYLLHPTEDPEPQLVERAAVYAGLLEDAGYDRVEFDLLAGASAGGLNAVVHAVAQRAGTDLDALGRLWAEHGALGRLLRPLGRRPVASLLQGDGYLWPRLLDVLVQLHGTAAHHPDLVAEQVAVELSATVLDSDPSPYSAAAEGRGEFHFAAPEPGSPAPRLDNGIPGRETAREETAPAEAAAALSRLAYAARTTASFPGAFEPASVWSAPTPGPRRSPGPPGGLPDLSHAFGAHRNPRQLPYRVVDGGVFDNVPIDRALDAARTRTSLRHADRCLLYLDPDPPRPDRTESAGRDLPRLVDTLAATAARLHRRESDDDEVLALSDFLGSQLVARGRRHPLAALIDSWDAASLEERRRAYLRYRGRADSDLLGRLFTRPAQWQLTSTLVRRDALRARRPAELEPLRAVLLRSCDELSRGPLEAPAAAAVLCGPQALFDAASCVLSWVRVLEELALDGVPGPLTGLDAAQARARAYRILAVARHERDRLFSDALASCADPSVPLTRAVPVWLGTAEAPGRAGTALGASWRELDAVVDGLRGLHGVLDEELDADGAERAERRAAWRASPWSTIPGPAVPLAAGDLPPLLAAAGIPPAVSRVAYGEIRGDQAPAEPETFAELRAAAARGRLQRALDADHLPADRLERLLAGDDGRLPAETKLAGTGLRNFRGFLATGWRTNDWWWGRLDAAAGAAGFLRSLPVVPARPAPEPTGAPPGEPAPEPGPAEQRGAPAASPIAGPGAAGNGAAGNGTVTDGTVTDGTVTDAALNNETLSHGSVHGAALDGMTRRGGDVDGGNTGRRTEAAAAAAALQESLLREVGRGSAERGRATVAAGADELSRLAPAHRLSLASRGLRVLGRALSGTPDLPRPVWEAVLLVLQPLLVVAPAAVVPVRAAVVAAFGVTGLWLVTGPAAAGAENRVWPAAVVLALVAGVLIASLARTALRARRRWAAVRDAAHGGAVIPDTQLPDARIPGTRIPDSPTVDAAAPVAPGRLSAGEVRAARNHALRRAGAAAVAAVSLVVPLWAAVASGHGLVAGALVAAVICLERLAAFLALRVPGRGDRDEVVHAALVVLAAVAGWAVAVAAVPAPVTTGARAAVLGVALLVLGLLLLAGWLRPGWAVAIAVAAAALGAAVALPLWAWAGGPGSASADLLAVGAAGLLWAAALWWAPAEAMLVRTAAGGELLPRRESPGTDLRTGR